MMRARNVYEAHMQHENFRRSCWFCGEQPKYKYTNVNGVEYKILFYAGYDDLLNCHVNIIEVDGVPKMMLHYGIMFPKIIMTEEQLVTLVNDLMAGKEVVSPFVNKVHIKEMPGASGLVNGGSITGGWTNFSASAWTTSTATYTGSATWVLATETEDV